MNKTTVILPVLGSVFVGVGDKVASRLGVVMILRGGQDQGWQISCVTRQTIISIVLYIVLTINC